MRGKASSSAQQTAKKGITPAYAGKRIDAVIVRSSGLGSPPRMRGKGSCMNRSASASWDHPRVCGEKSTLGSSSG